MNKNQVDKVVGMVEQVKVKPIETIDDALDIFMEIKKIDRADGKNSEWTITKINLKNIFDYDVENVTKNRAYLAYQSLLVNKIYEIYVLGK